ncbi:MAG: hypothetical protein JXR62_05585 [Bacilli bacterium]|nr:hypothetical protein [Bacilli bacterium]
MKKILKLIGFGVPMLVLIIIVGLFIYSRGSYTALPEMDDALAMLDDSSFDYYEDRDEIRYTVDNPLKNIIIIPGGLVEPDSYRYLAALLAKEGYNVVIAKAIFNLAILNPWIGKQFISDSLDNVVIGHSLGGVTASSVFSGMNEIDAFVFLGSYPIKDVSHANTLFLEAEFDLGMDLEALEDNMKFVNEDTNTRIFIEGGNHAQYGWYGPQKGDGEATLTTFEQQNLVANYIFDFLTGNE